MRLPTALAFASPLLFSAVCLAAPASSEERVIRWLNLTASGYCKAAAPPPDEGSAVVVTVNAIVNELLEVNNVKQLISLDSYIIMQWTDRRLAWDRSGSAELMNTSEVFLPIDQIWIPDIMVMRPIDVRSFQQGKTLANVKANGAVHLSLSYGTTTKCNMKLQNFPFDNQNCSIYLNSAPKTVEQLKIKAAEKPINGHLVSCSKNNEFCVTNIETTAESKLGIHDYVRISVYFKRKPLYYVTVLIVPSALILATCIFGFLLPADSGDRLALNVAILLSMSVFLQLAGSITPAQSESVPVLTWYFMVAMTVTTLSTVGSIIVHLCYRRAASGEAVSNRALRLLFLNRLCGWKTTVENFETCKDEAPKPPSGSVAMVTMKINPESEWRQIGCSIDRLLISCCVGCSALLVVFIVAAAVRNESIPCPAQCEY